MQTFLGSVQKLHVTLRKQEEAHERKAAEADGQGKPVTCGAFARTPPDLGSARLVAVLRLGNGVMADTGWKCTWAASKTCMLHCVSKNKCTSVRRHRRPDSGPVRDGSFACFRSNSCHELFGPRFFGIGVGPIVARGVPKVAKCKVSHAHKCTRTAAGDAPLCCAWPATGCARTKQRNSQAKRIPARHVSRQREQPSVLYGVNIPGAT